MYKQLIRPLLFQLPPETIHHLIMAAMRVLHYIPGGRLLLRMFYTTRHPSLVREVFGIRFPNPVGLAAGFDKDAEVYEEMASLGFGFVEVGTITPLAQPGNPKPRLFRLPMDHALINRMGFNNQGVASAVHRLHRRNRFYHRRHPVVLGGNLGKNTLTPNEKAPADYLRLFRSLYEYVNYFVINVSCPNVANLSCLQNKEHLKKLLEGLIDFRRGQNHYRPILLKISPDLSDEQIDEMIEVLVENGLDGIVATNTTTSRQGLLTPSDLVAEIGADVILLAKNIDGVYNADPAKVADAVKYDAISYEDVLAQHLAVMDSTATSLSMDNHIPVLVFALKDPKNILRAVMGEKIGTIVGE